MKKNLWIVIEVIILFFIVILIFVNQGSQKQVTTKSVLPGIEKFISSNSQYGTIKETKDMPDWASGKRQQVITNTGEYLFYLYGNEVVGVWKYKSDGGRVQIFHKDIPELPKNIERKSTDELPAYTIIDQVDLISGGKYGDILIPTYSKSISKEVREKVFIKIAEKEGFTQATFYCTIKAYKANFSESFSKTHPNALKDGFLGQLN